MTDRELYILMQLNGGTFPVGGFSQSWGLETYVSEGRIRTGDEFRTFLRTYLISCIGKCEGPIILEACRLTGKREVEGFRELEQLSCASKVTRESRESALRMGKAFLRIMEPILEDPFVEEIIKVMGKREISYPVIYGAVSTLAGISPEEALSAYVYSTANTLLQSAIKLVPLGNGQAQQILYEEIELMERTKELAMSTSIDNITNFCPGIDIAGLKHENLKVRLYMS